MPQNVWYSSWFDLKPIKKRHRTLGPLPQGCKCCLACVCWQAQDNNISALRSGHDSFSRLLGILIWGQHDKNIDNNFRTSFKENVYVRISGDCPFWEAEAGEKGKFGACLDCVRLGRGFQLGPRRWKSTCQKEKNAWQINKVASSQIAWSYCFARLGCDVYEPSFTMSLGAFDLFSCAINWQKYMYMRVYFLLSHHFLHISDYLSNVFLFIYLFFAVCEK